MKRFFTDKQELPEHIIAHLESMLDIMKESLKRAMPRNVIARHESITFFSPSNDKISKQTQTDESSFVDKHASMQ